MKGYIIVVLFFINFAFAECRMASVQDEMTDQINHAIRCKNEQNDLQVAFYLYKEKEISNVLGELKMAFFLPTTTILDIDYTNNDMSSQIIQIRIDKNKYFEANAYILRDDVLGLSLTEEQKQELLKGQNLLIRYYDQKIPKTKKINIANIKDLKG